MTATPPQAADARTRAAIIAVAAGAFMANLDLFIVNLALPSIQQELPGSSLPTLSWVLTIYAAVFAAFLVPLGRWADRVGRRRGYVTGLSVFVAASALAAAAPSVEVLIALRAVQAAGAALLVPTSLSLLLAAVAPERRAAAIGSWAAASAIAAASGPVLGGLLVEASWRWIFLVNVPLGLAAVAVTLRALPESRDPQPGPRPDLIGAVALAAAAGALALGLVQGGAWGWASARTVAVFAGVIALGALCALRCARHPSPVVEPALLRRPGFLAANLAAGTFYAAFAGMLLALVLFMSGLWGYTPLRAGLGIAPGPLTVFVVAKSFAPRVLGRGGPGRAAAAGSSVFAAGFALWAVSWGAEPSYASQVLPGLLLTGVGVGLVLPATLVGGTMALPPERFATGSAILTMSRQLGAVAGTAGLVALLGAEPDTASFRAAMTLMVLIPLLVLVPARHMP